MSMVSDYPDFVRVEQWVGSPFLVGAQAGVNNGTVFGPFFCAPWEAISFDVQQATGVAVWIAFQIDYLDAPAGNVISTMTYVCRAGERITDVVPVHSLYVRFTMGLQAGPRGISVTVVPRRGFDPSTRMHSGLPLLGVQNQAIAASPATSTLSLAPIMAAHCTFTVSTSAAVWSAVLYEVDAASSRIAPLGSLGSAAGRGTGTITVDLPPSPVICVFANGDAAGRTWEASVVPQRI